MCNGSMLVHDGIFTKYGYWIPWVFGPHYLIGDTILLKINDPTFIRSGPVSSKINNRKASLMENNIGSNPKFKLKKNEKSNSEHNNYI